MQASCCERRCARQRQHRSPQDPLYKDPRQLRAQRMKQRNMLPAGQGRTLSLIPSRDPRTVPRHYTALGVRRNQVRQRCTAPLLLCYCAGAPDTIGGSLIHIEAKAAFARARAAVSVLCRVCVLVWRRRPSPCSPCIYIYSVSFASGNSPHTPSSRFGLVRLIDLLLNRRLSPFVLLYLYYLSCPLTPFSSRSLPPPSHPSAPTPPPRSPPCGPQPTRPPGSTCWRTRT